MRRKPGGVVHVLVETEGRRSRPNNGHRFRYIRGASAFATGHITTTPSR